MDLDDYFDNVDSALANISAYAAQRGDKDLSALVDDLTERWQSLDSYLADMAFVELTEHSEH